MCNFINVLILNGPQSDRLFGNLSVSDIQASYLSCFPTKYGFILLICTEMNKHVGLKSLGPWNKTLNCSLCSPLLYVGLESTRVFGILFPHNCGYDSKGLYHFESFPPYIKLGGSQWWSSCVLKLLFCNQPSSLGKFCHCAESIGGVM